MSRDSSVGIERGYGLDGPGSIPCRSKTFFTSQGPDRLWGPFSLLSIGRTITQAVSRWLPAEAARVRVRAACGLCGGHRGIGADFLRVLRFPLPINFSFIIITRGWHNRPIGGRSAERTQLYSTPHYLNFKCLLSNGYRGLFPRG
jgi:hypothetical protein